MVGAAGCGRGAIKFVLNKVKTPCVGICSTGIGDDVCRGCKRFEHEVIDWNGYSHAQKLIIAERLESYLAKCVAQRFEIFDEQLLLQQIQHQQIPFKKEQSPFCWVFDLLRAGASQIHHLADYGVQLYPCLDEPSLVDVCEAIDRDFYALSCAYYDRYIAPGLPSQLPTK